MASKYSNVTHPYTTRRKIQSFLFLFHNQVEPFIEQQLAKFESLGNTEKYFKEIAYRALSLALPLVHCHSWASFFFLKKLPYPISNHVFPMQSFALRHRNLELAAL